jgi:hypothetical protein
LSLFYRAGERNARALLVEYATAFAVALLLGLTTEIVQKILGRDASWFDLHSDVIGALAGCGAFAVFDQRLPTVRRRVVSGYRRHRVAHIALGSIRARGARVSAS